jgi:hypothetical protein
MYIICAFEESKDMLSSQFIYNCVRFFCFGGTEGRSETIIRHIVRQG